MSSISPTIPIAYNNHFSDHVYTDISMIYFIFYPSNYYKINTKSFNKKSSPKYIKSDYYTIKYYLSTIDWD